MNRFSKSISLTVLVLAMVFALVGCKTAKVEAPLEPAPVVEAPVVEAPVVEAPAPVVEAPAPVVEAPAPVAEAPAPVVEVAAELQPVERKYTLFGYEVSVVAGVGRAEVTYPADKILVTSDDLNAFVAAANASYDLRGVTYDVQGNKLILTYPESWGVQEFAIAEQAVMSYVAQVIAPATAGEPVSTAVVREINLYGYKATISYEDKVATITYPSFITNAEVAEAAKATFAAYGKYLQGTELAIDNGTAYLTFPHEITADDIDYAVALLSAELPSYVTALLTSAPVAEPEPVATVAEAPAPVVEAPAPVVEEKKEEAPAAAPAATPAATPAKTEETKPAATTTAPAATSAPAATPAATPAKKSSAGLIVVIIVLVAAACAACFIILKKKQK